MFIPTFREARVRHNLWMICASLNVCWRSWHSRFTLAAFPCPSLLSYSSQEQTPELIFVILNCNVSGLVDKIELSLPKFRSSTTVTTTIVATVTASDAYRSPFILRRKCAQRNYTTARRTHIGAT